MTDHERWRDDVGSYLLGALPPDELAGFEAHLSECAECRRELAELRVAADVLPMSVPVVAPPPALKGRIMAVVESEAQLLAAAGQAADAPPARVRRERRWTGWPLRPGVALACAAVLLVLGGVAGALVAGGGEDARTVVAQAEPRGADVRVDIGDDGATLVARHMPAPPEGRIYQVWIKRPGRDPQPTSVLWSVRGDGSADVAVPGSLDGVEAVLVTAEPPGGSDAPTGAPVISAPLA